MKNWPQEEEQFVARLSAIEASLDQLSADFESTTWRKSTIVDSCIKHAREELLLSITHFIHDAIDQSGHAANLAWLHVEFGRQLLDAETTEGLLGEGKFLELNAQATSPALIVKYFNNMEQRILALRGSIKEKIGAANL